MIKVLVSQNKIHVSGHANMAPYGCDIVCSAVSALTLTLLEGLRNIAHMKICASVETGNICMEWQTANDTGKALVDTWFLGMCGIAAQYPAVSIASE